MARTFYDVVASGDEWAVLCKSRLLTLHLDRQKAIAVAAAVAQGECDATGVPTGVRVQRRDGSLEEMGRFGADPVVPRRTSPALSAARP